MKLQLRHLTAGIIVITFLVIAFASSESSSTKSTATMEPVSVGQVGKTDYFEIIVNKVEINERVRTGNQFANLKAEPGNTYLIFNITFKNVDNESRMFTEGDVLINYNGKEYTFDHPETVMLEGWGTFLDQINPLTSKTTNLVYKIPSEITGNIFWRPGRNSSDVVFFLGNKQAEQK
jgi:Domain of unknown function (DUF4352)